MGGLYNGLPATLLITEVITRVLQSLGRLLQLVNCQSLVSDASYDDLEEKMGCTPLMPLAQRANVPTSSAEGPRSVFCKVSENRPRAGATN